jgi:hypothetical protein
LDRGRGLNSFLLKCIAVPLLEVSNQCRLLIVDCLLGKLSLILKFLQVLVGVTVLLLELFKLAKAVQLFFVDNLSLVAWHFIKGVMGRSETRVERLG